MPGLLNFLADPESQRAMKNGLLDAANRGMVASTLGGPVDVATTLTNLLIAGGGYAGHKAGLLSSPPELIDSRNVPGSSEWIGQKMQNAGMVSPNRNALAEAGMGLLSPVAFKGAQKMGGLLYNVEQNALANASKPSAMRMHGQRGAVAIAQKPQPITKDQAHSIVMDEDNSAIPEGWFLHGRSGGQKLSDDWPVMMTRDASVAYGYGPARSGSVWALRPNEKTASADFTSQNSADMDKFIAGLKAVYSQKSKQEGSAFDEIKKSIASRNGSSPSSVTFKDVEEYIRDAFSPRNIVDHAGAFDEPVELDLLQHYPGGWPDFVLTPDGAVALPAAHRNMDAINLSSLLDGM